MSAFTEPLAQVREALFYVGYPEGDYNRERDTAYAALAQVERLATDMETALSNLERAVAKWEGGYRIPEVNDARLKARAVLSAREEGADTP